MVKLNCWEFKKCGREPGGAKVDELGVCPAAVCEETDTLNSGKKAGRTCWAIAGTLCGGKVQGIFAMKFENCLKCDFFKLIRAEEGEEYCRTQEILNIIREKKNCGAK